MSDSIKKLQDLFAKFPTIGSRTAGRFVYYLLRQSKEDINALTSAIQELKSNIRFCNFCFQPFENVSNELLCEICRGTLRDKHMLCIVEKEADLLSIKKTKRYKGLYFILGGALNLRASNENMLRIAELTQRVKDPKKFGITSDGFKEIIIATNPTPEGKSTSLLIQQSLKEAFNSPTFKITRLAIGLPLGGELEYADEETLESSFEGRK